MPTGNRYSKPIGINSAGSETLKGTCTQDRKILRFSTTKRAYLKNTSNARLLTRLISNQILRLLYNDPAAINNTRTPSNAIAGRKDLGPKMARHAIPAANARAATNEFLRTRSSKRGLVNFVQSPTWSVRRGQWSIKATRKKSRTVE